MPGFKTKKISGSGALRGAAPGHPRPPLRATLRELGTIILAVAAIISAAWVTAAVGRDLLHPDPVPMPIPVAHTRKLVVPMVINIAVDDSHSMSWSDPNNDRWKSVKAVLGWLKKYERARDQVVLTRFTNSAELGPVRSVHRVTGDPRALAPEPVGGGTAFLPVVGAAERAFARANPRAYKVLLIVTDGDSPDRAAAVAALPSVANAVYVIALSRSFSWRRAARTWEHGGFPVTPLANRAPNEVGAALAREIVNVTGEKTK